MYMCIAYPDGAVLAEIPNPAVCTDLLREILHLKAKGCADQDVITLLRPRTVPKGYVYTTWTPGKF